MKTAKYAKHANGGAASQGRLAGRGNGDGSNPKSGGRSASARPMADRKPKEGRRPKAVRKGKEVAAGLAAAGEVAELYRAARAGLAKSVYVGRECRGWGWSDMARETGLSVRDVYNLEGGMGEVTLSTLVRIGLAFGGLKCEFVAPKEEKRQ